MHKTLGSDHLISWSSSLSLSKDGPTTAVKTQYIYFFYLVGQEVSHSSFDIYSFLGYLFEVSDLVSTDPEDAVRMGMGMPLEDVTNLPPECEKKIFETMRPTIEEAAEEATAFFVVMDLSNFPVIVSYLDDREPEKGSDPLSLDLAKAHIKMGLIVKGWSKGQSFEGFYGSTRHEMSYEP